jgi:uncharacterized protein YbaP (TraB family)
MTLFAALPPILHRRALSAAAFAWLSFLAVALPAPLAGAPAAEVPYGQGLLWRIERPDDVGAAPSYLFGTMHITDERVLKLPPPVREAFESSSSATFEVIMTNETRTKMSTAMVLRDGRTLDQIVGAKRFEAVVAAGRRYGLPPDSLRQFKPWAIATVFSIPQAELARAAHGELPLDQSLQAAAMQEGKPLHALETAEEQISLFDDMSEADQVAMLTAAVEQNATIESLFEEMTHDYLNRDTGALYARMQKERETQPELMELFLRRFNDARNKTMAERMTPHLTEGGAFIAIGALHLPSKSGLLSLLSQRGYTVTRVY